MTPRIFLLTTTQTPIFPLADSNHAPLATTAVGIISHYTPLHQNEMPFSVPSHKQRGIIFHNPNQRKACYHQKTHLRNLQHLHFSNIKTKVATVHDKNSSNKNRVSTIDAKLQIWLNSGIIWKVTISRNGAEWTASDLTCATEENKTNKLKYLKLI